MASKPSTRKIAPPAPEADPRFVPVARAFARAPDVSLMGSKSGAMRGLMCNGKSFGMSTHGRFVLKLTEDRVAALITEGTGKPFQPSAGRVLRGWIEVTDPKADWVALAKEAHRLARAEKKPVAKVSAAKKPAAKKPATKTSAAKKARR